MDCAKPLPSETLDPKIKHTWRIADGIGMGLLDSIVMVPLIALGSSGSISALVALIVGVLMLALTLFVLLVLPNIRYARWRWRVTEGFLEIAKGIIWRRRTVIPFIRVQNTDTRQGPLMRAFGLADVTVATAAGEHVIPGLSLAAAEALRDQAAELARIAREDI